MKPVKLRGVIFAYKGIYWPGGPIDVPGCNMRSAALTTTMTGCSKPRSRGICAELTKALRFEPFKKGEPPFQLPVKQLKTSYEAVDQMDYLRTAVDALLRKKR